MADWILAIVFCHFSESMNIYPSDSKENRICKLSFVDNDTYNDKKYTKKQSQYMIISFVQGVIILGLF
jgi:hypothetical protein